MWSGSLAADQALSAPSASLQVGTSRIEPGLGWAKGVMTRKGDLAGRMRGSESIWEAYSSGTGFILEREVRTLAAHPQVWLVGGVDSQFSLGLAFAGGPGERARAHAWARLILPVPRVRPARMRRRCGGGSGPAVHPEPLPPRLRPLPAPAAFLRSPLVPSPPFPPPLFRRGPQSPGLWIWLQCDTLPQRGRKLGLPRTAAPAEGS